MIIISIKQKRIVAHLIHRLFVALCSNQKLLGDRFIGNFVKKICFRLFTCDGVIKSSRSVNCKAPLKREAIFYSCLFNNYNLLLQLFYRQLKST